MGLTVLGLSFLLYKIRFIFCLFRQDRSGSVSVGEFLSVPELKENPLVKRVVDVFDDDLSGEVDFKGKDPARNPIPVVQYIATILVSFYLGDCLTRLTAYYRLVFYLVNHKNWVVSNGLKTCKIWRVLANILVSFLVS